MKWGEKCGKKASFGKSSNHEFVLNITTSNRWYEGEPGDRERDAIFGHVSPITKENSKHLLQGIISKENLDRLNSITSLQSVSL